MKITFKNIAVVVVILSMIMVVLTAIDKANDTTAVATNTAIKITVVDLDNNPVHNATVTVCGQTFYCDNNGNSPIIDVGDLTNCYDESITSWGTANVIVTKGGYVPTVVLNCVIFDKQTRKLTVKVYADDGSNLPYVCYVETPPDEYLKSLLSTSNA